MRRVLCTTTAVLVAGALAGGAGSAAAAVRPCGGHPSYYRGGGLVTLLRTDLSCRTVRTAAIAILGRTLPTRVAGVRCDSAASRQGGRIRCAAPRRYIIFGFQ